MGNICSKHRRNRDYQLRASSSSVPALKSVSTNPTYEANYSQTCQSKITASENKESLPTYTVHPPDEDTDSQLVTYKPQNIPQPANYNIKMSSTDSKTPSLTLSHSSHQQQHTKVKDEPASVPNATSVDAYKAIIRCHDDLVTAISTDILTISGILVAKEFIPAESSSKMLLPNLTPQEKATSLVIAITKKIKLVPNRFQELIKIFSEQTCTKDIVNSLQSHLSCKQDTEEDINDSDTKVQVISSSQQYAVYESHMSTACVNLNPADKSDIEASLILTDTEVKRKEFAALNCEQSSSESDPIVSSVVLSALDPESLNKEQKEQLHQRLYADSEDMMYKFQGLFTATSKSLQKENITVSQLASCLGLLGSIKPTFKDSGLPPLRHQLPRLTNAKTIEAAMSVVKDYCSFFNYRMLEHIINELGTKEDKLNLDKYKEDFSKYGMRHVFECPSKVGEMSRDDHVDNMFVTLDDSFDNCDVNHLQSFISILRKTLRITSNISMKLCRIDPGSVRLTFQLPHLVQQDIFPLSKEQEEELASLGVIELSCRDYHFIRQDTTITKVN